MGPRATTIVISHHPDDKTCTEDGCTVGTLAFKR